MIDRAGKNGEAHGDYVDFHPAGSAATGAFHCSGCGYGVTVQVTLPPCPMCRGTTWEPAPARAVVHDRR